GAPPSRDSHSGAGPAPRLPPLRSLCVLCVLCGEKVVTTDLGGKTGPPPRAWTPRDLRRLFRDNPSPCPSTSRAQRPAPESACLPPSRTSSAALPSSGTSATAVSPR